MDMICDPYINIGNCSTSFFNFFSFHYWLWHLLEQSWYAFILILIKQVLNPQKGVSGPRSFFWKIRNRGPTDRPTDRQTDGQHLLIKSPRRRLKIKLIAIFWWFVSKWDIIKIFCTMNLSIFSKTACSFENWISRLVIDLQRSLTTHSIPHSHADLNTEKKLSNKNIKAFFNLNFYRFLFWLTLYYGFRECLKNIVGSSEVFVQR